jgi:catechol 2,3-dioxygenase-like lactoylglutathione lyase family enzyme
MAYRINHIDLKAPDPRRTAEWYVTAFGFTITSDEVRVFGDRFIRCASADGGIDVNISGARTGETLGAGDANPHHGLDRLLARAGRYPARAGADAAPVIRALLSHDRTY